MERLAIIMSSFKDLDYLVAEIKAGSPYLETIEDLADYLEEELSYAE